MGWNTVSWRTTTGPAVAAEPEQHFYFVHAYHARPRDPAVVAAETDYGGPFCAVVERGRLWATQFHPEKSQRAGLRLLTAFLSSWRTG
jgi:glutamine amidotransferase